MNQQNRPYWEIYHSKDDLERSQRLRQTYMLHSTGVNLHIDAYEQADPLAPVLIFNHGGGGYSRLFIPLALKLYDKGYTVLLPDQRGQGLSDGARGDFTIAQATKNILDVAHWARETYAGTLFMAGGSLGGGLTYYAAAAGAPVTAIICHNLYDFGNPRNALALSRFSMLRHIPGVPSLFRYMLLLGARLVPTLRLPRQLVGRFEKMVDPRVAGFYDQYVQDPIPVKSFPLSNLASMFNTSPAIPLEKNTMPALVINQKRDEMVTPMATLENYNRLGGKTQYVEIDYGHWAIGDRFEEEWVGLVDSFLKQFLISE